MLSNVCIGQIVGVHGIKGTVKIKPRLTDVACLNTLKPITDKTGTQTFEITIKGKKNEILLCQIKGINDRTTAETLKGCELFVPRSSLPAESENEFYDYVENSKNLTYYDIPVTAEYGDTLLTLSTCAYHVDEGRFVVVAKKID